MAYWCAKHLSMKYILRSKSYGLLDGLRSKSYGAPVRHASLNYVEHLRRALDAAELRQAFVNKVHTPE